MLVSEKLKDFLFSLMNPKFVRNQSLLRGDSLFFLHGVFTSVRLWAFSIGISIIKRGKKVWLVNSSLFILFTLGRHIYWWCINLLISE